MAPVPEETFLATRNPVFRRVLEFERDCSALLEYTSRAGQPYWMMVRWHLCRIMQDRVNGTKTRHVGNRYDVGILNLLQFALYSLIDFVRLAIGGHYNIVFFNTGVGNVKSESGYLNRLTDLMAACYTEQTILLEKHDVLRYHKPRVFPHVRVAGLIQVLEKTWENVGVMPREQRARLNDFFNLLHNSFGDLVTPGEWSWLKRKCRGKVRGESLSLRMYTWILRRLQPRILMLEDGHYGSSGPLLAAARRLQIILAEYQHGLVSPNHEAYNYHPTVLRRGYALWLPDYFLTYGEYWSRIVSTSAEIYAVGNPYLDMQMRKVLTESAPARSILFLSTSLDPGRYREVLSELVQSGYRVRFRPHPCERLLLSTTYGQFFQDLGIEIDAEPDLYRSIVQSEIVLGDISTSVLEAAALKKPVFLLNHPTTQSHMANIFPMFNSVSELVGLINTFPNSCKSRGDIWQSDWESRYRGWIRRVATSVPEEVETESLPRQSLGPR
jgi:hypothetical protein